MALDFDITQIEQIYDSLNTRIRTDLQSDFDCKKINGPTFADTWAKMMSPVIQSSVSAAISLATKETPTDILVKLKQIDVMSEDILVKKEQVNKMVKEEEVMDQDILNKVASESLTRRQEAGFDDNVRQKLYEAQMNAWALMFSSGLLEDKPEHITNGNAGALATAIQSSVGGGGGITNPLGYFTIDVSATAESGGSTTVTWGSVAGATAYTLYAFAADGSLAGYPKAVSANGSESITLIMPNPGYSKTYTFRVVAFDSTGQFARDSKSTLVVSTPIP